MAFTGPDDLGALVIDIGAGTTKCGLAGGDAPAAVVPTVIGTSLASSSSSSSSDAPPQPSAKRRYGRGGRLSFDVHAPLSSLRSPLADGVVDDWEGMEALLEYALSERLALADVGGGGGPLDLSQHPVVLAEHLHASKADRERWAQLLFERHNAAGLFVAKAGVLALYANARTTGLVVDMGAGGTQVTPVQEGYPLMMGAKLHAAGGRHLDAQLLHSLEGRGVTVKPAASSKARGAADAAPPHASLTAWNRLELVRDIKETVCRVSDEALLDAGAGDAAASSALPSASATYELPDGQTVTLANERLGVPETIFQPSRGADSTATSPFSSSQGLHELIAASAMACDPEARRDLVGNLVLTGGASRMSGLPERLVKDFNPIAPVGTRARWASASPEERAYGPWLGGSILGSLGTFHDMWLSAAEYKEHGAKLIHRKCP